MLAEDLSQTFLSTGITADSFQQYGKRRILIWSSPSTYDLFQKRITFFAFLLFFFFFFFFFFKFFIFFYFFFFCIFFSKCHILWNFVDNIRKKIARQKKLIFYLQKIYWVIMRFRRSIFIASKNLVSFCMANFYLIFLQGNCESCG